MVKKAQKNVRMSEITRQKFDALTAVHGTEVEVIAVALDHLYRLEIGDQTDLGDKIGSARDYILSIVDAPECELRFRHSAEQTLADMPDWIELRFPTEDAKREAAKRLEYEGITPHPATVVAGLALTLRTDDVI